MDATVNVHNALTALLCFGTTPKIDSSLNEREADQGKAGP